MRKIHLIVTACSWLLCAPLGAQIVPGLTVNAGRFSGNQAEPSSAVDPADPMRMFVASNTTGPGLMYSYTTDGGANWTTSVIAGGSGPLWQACCDSSVAFDSFGNLWLSYVGQDVAVKLALSKNGGQTWQRVISFGNGDEPSVTAANGAVWVMYHDGAGTISAAGAHVSGLGNVGAFTAPEAAPGSSKCDYGDIALGPQGEVLITYQSPYTGKAPGEIYVSLDPDGLGPQGFNAAVHVTHTAVGAFDSIPGQSHRAVDAEAGLAWDRSGGLYNNRVYLVYTDEFPHGSGNTDILLRRSDNRGATWSAPVRVNDDATAASQFLPRVAIDEHTGNAAFSWYDCRNDSGSGPGDTDGIANDDAEVFATLSNDGGISFLPNVQVGSVPSNAASSGTGFDFGDYEALAFDGGNFYPVWSDNSNSTGDNPDGALSYMDIYMGRVQDATGGPALALIPAALPGGVIQMFYNQALVPGGGTAPYTFNETGALPAGLSLNCSTASCILSGAPASSGMYAFSVTVTDSAGHSGTRNYVLRLAASCLFCDDFQDGVLSTSWTYLKPSWLEQDGSLIGRPAKSSTTAIASPAYAGCGVCSLEATVTSSGGTLSLLGWYQDPKNSVELLMKDSADKWILRQRVNGTIVAKGVAVSEIIPNKPYDLKIIFDGINFTFTVDDAALIVLPAASPPFGTVGFVATHAGGSLDFVLVN